MSPDFKRSAPDSPSISLPAIILAAGRGSRMGGLTEARPKCLTPLAGRPLLDWQLDALAAAGVTRITVIGGYRADCLRRPGLEIRLNDRWEETNMVGSLLCADDLLAAEPCLVAYSDIVYRAAHVRELAAAPGELAITYDAEWKELWELRFASPLDDAETFETRSGRLVEIGGRAHSMAEIKGQYMGLLRFTPTAWACARALVDRLTPVERDRIDMTTLLRRLLSVGEPIDCVPVSGGWCEVDSPSDLAAYEARLASGVPWLHDWRQK